MARTRIDTGSSASADSGQIDGRGGVALAGDAGNVFYQEKPDPTPD
jgi:hypothetical protein